MPRKRAISPDRVFVDARPQLGGSIVKSAQRVLELFELFSDIRSGLTVADVASKLKMPQSSTSSLLRSLHTLGYLSVDPQHRTYSPTSRVALLGHWIDPLLVAEGPIIAMSRELTETTGVDSLLAIRNKLHVQVVYRRYPPNPKSHGPTGSGSFLVLAATGHILMCDMPDREVTLLVNATNAQLAAKHASVDSRALIAKLAEVRRQGYAFGRSQRSPDRITFAVRLPDATVEPIAFGITVAEKNVTKDPSVWADLLKQSVQKWLGPQQTLAAQER
jgi:DNA-binding IclR family transcriptional regulator